MKIELQLTPRRLAAGAVGVLVAAAVVAVPVMAATPSPAAAGASTSTATASSCLSERIAAKTTPTVASLQALGDCAVGQRLATLATLQGVVDGAQAFTSDHRTTLDAAIGDAKTGLTALKTKIDADTSVTALRTDLGQISTGFRVDKLVAKQVSLVRDDDALAAEAARLTADAGQIQAAITAGQGAGKNETTASARLATMQAAITAAQGQLTGQADHVLALTPAQWNGGTAELVLNADRSAAAAARGDLAEAANAENGAVAALK